MNTTRRLDEIPGWLIKNLPDRLSIKDKARVLAINSFGLTIVIVGVIYAAVFKVQNDDFMFWTCLGIAGLCIIPPALNYFHFYDFARMLYVFQAPIFVLFFASILGSALGVQYFFVILFGFPFIYFKPNEKKRTIWFFIYTIFCLLYFEFGGPVGMEEATFTPQMFVTMKITVLSLFILMSCILFFVFHQIIIKDEQKLVRIKYEMEKANQVKQEFLATMSHELRTPLNAVVTITNILEENPEHKDKYAFLKLLKQSSNNLLSIINDILDFSKLEANKMKLELRSLDIRQTITSIAETYRSMAEEKGLNLSINLDSGLSKHYKFDDVKLGQILGNLISNAIKFTNDGEVTMSVFKEETEGYFDVIRFEVADTGQGIAPEELEDIFESFSQIKSVLTRNTGGTGLGLAIVKRLLKLQKSDITVESAQGIGSKFYFKLRLKVSGKVSNQKNKEFAPVLNKKVLLVEDNTVNAMVAEKLLENWGLIIHKAENGQIALDKFASEVFDFVLMDLHMPIMDGFEAARAIREGDYPNRYLPIYALTADVMGEGNEEFNKYFDGFFTKPIQKEKLQHVLVETLSKKG